MISYRDRTYCEASDCARWSDCDRALTDEVREAAERWWGFGPKGEPPISVFVGKPECWEE